MHTKFRAFLCALAILILTAPLCGADVGGPVISASLSPTSLPVTGGTITVTATVTDPNGATITNVTASLYGNGNYLANNVTLSNGGTGNVYTGIFGGLGSNTSNNPNAYTAVVTATNASRLSNTFVTAQTTQANDTTPPTITSAALSPTSLPVTGGTVTITATVTDPNGRAVTSVRASLYSNGNYLANNVTLSNGGVGNVYTGTFGGFSNNTSNNPNIYTAVLTATNDLNLSNTIDVGQTVQANDATPPIVTNLSLSPVNLPVTGGGITLMATVTDPNGRAVTSVRASLYGNGNYLANNIMLSNGGVGNVYTGTFGVGSNTGNVPIIYTALVTGTNDLNLSNSALTNGQIGQGNSGPPASLVPLLLTSDPSKPVLNPAILAAGSPDTTLTINGVNFAADAVVSINGVELAASLISKDSATQITVTVPAILLANPGALAVSVISPSLGILSNMVNLNVYGLTAISVPSPVAGGTVVTARVALNGPAPANIVIGLSSSDSSVVRVHRSVVVPTGSTSATFQINTYRSHVTKTVTMQASEGQVTLAAPLTITGR